MLENEEKKKVYVTVRNNKFTVKTREGEGTQRTTKTGKTVWENEFSKLTGRITNVKKKTTEWEGKKIVSWDVQIADGNETMVLSLNYGSSEARSFLSRLPNIETDSDVTLNVFPFAGENKKEHTYISAWQFGNKVKPFYTKENLPGMKKIVFKGEERWDDSEQQAVFEKMVLERYPLEKKYEPETHEEEPDNGSLPF